MRILITLFYLSFSVIYANPTLDKINLGKHVSGPKISAKSLKGKIVLFEYWGVNCPPCLRSIPHLTEWQEKYDQSNFIIIANQCQTQDVGQASSVWKKRGGKDNVSVINHGGLQGAKVSGIPRCFLFDQNGKLIFDGSPFKVQDAIEKAYKATPGALVAGMEYKHCKKEAHSLGRRKGSFASIIAKLEKKKNSGNDETVKEAEYLLTRIGEWVEEGKELVEKYYSDNPLKCEKELKTRIKTIGKHEYADWFMEKSKEVKSKEYRREITAFKSFEKWKSKGEKAGLLESDIKPSVLKHKKAFIKGGNSIVKKYPDTIAGRKANEIIDSMQ